jgi:thiol:disulfide interchange protein DsbD
MIRRTQLSIAFTSSIILAAMILLAGCGGKDLPDDTAIPWSSDLSAAIAKAHSENGIVMVDFTAVWCPPCRAMEDSTFGVPDVVKKASSFIPVRIDVDAQREVAEKYGGNARKYGGIGIPNILFLDGEGHRIKQVVGYHGPRRFIAVMDSVLTL